MVFYRFGPRRRHRTWVRAQGSRRGQLVRGAFHANFLARSHSRSGSTQSRSLPLHRHEAQLHQPLYMALIVIFLAVKNGESFSCARPVPSCWVSSASRSCSSPVSRPRLPPRSSGSHVRLLRGPRLLPDLPAQPQEPEWRIVFTSRSSERSGACGFALAGGMTPVTWTCPLSSAWRSP